MEDKKKSYKERNGTTRVGDFLRKINFKSAANVVANVLSGDIKGAIETITGSDELSDSQKEIAIRQIEQDTVKMQEVTKRWEADLHSDSWLSKNIRPLTLLFLLLCMFVFIILDSSLEGFKINIAWITLLQSLLVTAVGGYFVIRGGEKIVNRFKK
tara:strand:- start:206 stop:673 length:468 start_codon:yes stop_codon:yes gene_type:complete